MKRISDLIYDKIQSYIIKEHWNTSIWFIRFDYFRGIESNMSDMNSIISQKLIGEMYE